jgi:putative peptidoglycan lipid II flippase
MLAFGDVIAALLFQRGRFGAADSEYVWSVLAGSSVGLLAATLGRLYASAFYALHDTRTPLWFAAIRVALTSALGYTCALPLPRLLGIDPSWGTAGLTASAGVAAWVEFALLRRALGRRIGPIGIPSGRVRRLWLAAIAAVAAGFAVKLALGPIVGGRPLLLSPAVLAAYGLSYLGLAAALGVAPAPLARRPSSAT